MKTLVWLLRYADSNVFVVDSCHFVGFVEVWLKFWRLAYTGIKISYARAKSYLRSSRKGIIWWLFRHTCNDIALQTWDTDGIVALFGIFFTF